MDVEKVYEFTNSVFDITKTHKKMLDLHQLELNRDVLKFAAYFDTLMIMLDFTEEQQATFYKCATQLSEKYFVDAGVQALNQEKE